MLKVPTVTLDDFVDDRPWSPSGPVLEPVTISGQIDGVEMRRLCSLADGRGDLTVLMSAGAVPGFSTPHVYLVSAAAGSVRAWVYHKRQSDRLAYVRGTFRVVLYDLRPDSRTFGALNVLDVGADNPVVLTIPPFVVHGVENRGATDSFFVNMPTRAYDPQNPDKTRLPKDHPGVPYSFG